VTLATQAAADFLKFDGLEAVTYVARRTDEQGNPQETKIAIANALRRAVGYRDRSLGVVSVDDVATTWHVRKQDIIDPVSEAVVTPQRGDTIIDGDGQKWGIRSFDLQTLSVRYRFVSVMGEM